MEVSEVFEAVSHPLRLRILKLLAEEPLSFSELKRRLKIDSSGHLDFHLKKLEGFVEEKDGKYTLTRNGYAALQTARSLSRLEWQRRAYFLNWLVAILFIAFFTAMKPSALWVVIAVASTWLAFYPYWTFIKRKVSLRGP